MATPSPPKPWERAGAGATSSGTPAIPATTAGGTSTPVTSTASSASDPPILPDRPSTLNSVVNRTASNYSPYGASRLGTSPYGGIGSYGTYSSPYSRFGGYGGSMYGGYGSMGGMYGGMGGMGGMGYGMGGMPNDPNSLTNSFSQSTQATFQLIENIVGAFGGFAQMLESTYMATHSSFFAMVSVAEQFGNLRNTLGSVLGIFTILRWIRTLIAKVTGRPPPADATALTPANFAIFEGRPAPDGSVTPKPSKKPFVFFILAVFGLPYLMGKLIRALARSQEEEEKRRLAQVPQGQQQPFDPHNLSFCRVMYDYNPETSQDGVDLAVKKGEFVAVLSKSDPMGNPSEWWRCRARDGRMGYLPSPYLQTIQRPAAITSGSQPASRASTMTSDQAPGGLATKEAKAPEVSGKPGDISAESFQKSQFYT